MAKSKTKSARSAPTASKKITIKSSNKRNAKAMLVVMVLIAILGTIAFVRWRNATGAAAIKLTTFEAESFNLPEGASVISDTSASAGQAIAFESNGTASKVFSLDQPFASLAIKVRAIRCKSSPRLVVTIDGLKTSSRSVSAGGWQEIVMPLRTKQVGTHTVTMSVTNFNTKNTCASNVYVDSVSIIGEISNSEPKPSTTSTPSNTPTPTPTATSTVRPSATPSTTPTPTPSISSNPNAGLPRDLLDLTNWKLTLPIETSHEGNPDEIKQPELASYSLSPYFMVNGAKDGVIFRAHAGGATTSGSGYPRSELREMANNGKDLASWTNTSGTHTMTIRQAITKTTSAKPHVVAGQIHDKSDDVVMIRLEGKNLFVEAGGKEIGTLNANYALGTVFTVRLEAAGGHIKIYYDGVQKVDYAKSGSGLYFKAGCYTQSNTSKGDSASDYGEVIIYSLQVSHS